MTTVNSANVLRAAILSSYDGIVSNLGVAIVVGAAKGDVVLATLAAILGGAISMSSGELVSVWVQNEALEDDQLSPVMAAGVSVVSFSVCGLLPLLGWLALGLPGALLVGITCLGIVGIIASRFTAMGTLQLTTRLIIFGVIAGVFGVFVGVLL